MHITQQKIGSHLIMYSMKRLLLSCMETVEGVWYGLWEGEGKGEGVGGASWEEEHF